MEDIFKNAKWVWHNDYHIENVYLDFFETLAVQSCKNYKMYISGDTNYALYINGTFVESGQYSDYPQYKVYDILNITPYLLDGENHLRILGYHQGKDSFSYRLEPAGMLYSITCDDNVVLTSGENTKVALNSSYKNEGVSMVTGQLGFTYEYDVLKEDEKIGLKNADIQNKVVKLFPRPIKKLDIGAQMPSNVIAWGEIKDNGSQETLGERMQNAYMSFRYNGDKKPLPNNDGINFEVQSGDGIYIIIDLGCETVGYTDIKIELPTDCEILIGHGEHLEDLRVRATISGRVFAASYKGKKGINNFFNPLRRMGLRYLQLNIYSKTAKLYYAGIKPTHYPVNYKPRFKCSDNLHNKIYDVSLKTLEHCMHEHYEDCPWREQALYAMDSRNQMLCGYYAFGEFDFAKACLRLIGLSIREDNLLELCSPARAVITIPSFCAIYITQLYEYLIHSGDTEFIKEMLDTALRVTDEFANRICENGLIKALSEKQYWNFYEWQDGLSGAWGIEDESKVTYDAPLNAFVSMAFSSLAGIFKILGDNQKSEKYEKLHNDINTAIDREFWVDEKNIYATNIYVANGEKFHFSELTQSLTVYCGACPKNKLDAVLESLAGGNLLEVTLSHSIFKYEALMQKPEKYAKFVLDNIASLWGHMLYNNATTFWETIDGATAFTNAGSLCHGWSAIPIYIYFKYAAGLNVSHDGKISYVKNPINCGLYEIEALLCTPKGEIKTTI